MRLSFRVVLLVIACVVNGCAAPRPVVPLDGDSGLQSVEILVKGLE